MGVCAEISTWCRSYAAAGAGSRPESRRGSQEVSGNSEKNCIGGVATSRFAA